MATIVTFGTAILDDVESYLNLKTVIAAATDRNGAVLENIIYSIDSWLRVEIGRKFEQTTYTDEIFDVEEDQRIVLMSDRPVTTFTNLKRVTSRDSNGVATLETINADEYVTYLDEGYVKNIVGSYLPGAQQLRATYTAGYTSAQLTASTPVDEVAIWKALELSMIAHEWGVVKENKMHIRNISFGGESVTYEFDLNFWQIRMLEQLKLHNPVF